MIINFALHFYKFIITFNMLGTFAYINTKLIFTLRMDSSVMLYCCKTKVYEPSLFANVCHRFILNARSTFHVSTLFLSSKTAYPWKLYPWGFHVMNTERWWHNFFIGCKIPIIWKPIDYTSAPFMNHVNMPHTCNYANMQLI